MERRKGAGRDDRRSSKGCAGRLLSRLSTKPEIYHGAPTFVVDAPGGGGKRVAHSFEHYNRKTSISVYSAPSVKPGKLFLYFDPVDQLDEAHQARWKDEKEQAVMIEEALKAARAGY